MRNFEAIFWTLAFIVAVSLAYGLDHWRYTKRFLRDNGPRPGDCFRPDQTDPL